MTAGVQNLDSAAYLPSPPSTSTPDAKGAGAADRKTADSPSADPQGQPSDFQSELHQQQASEQAGTPQTGTPQKGDKDTRSAGANKAGVSKRDDSRPGKKRGEGHDNNLSMVASVPVDAAQKPILPLALALAQPRESAKPDQKAAQDDNAQEPSQQAGQAMPASIAANAQLPGLRQPAALKPSAKQAPAAMQAAPAPAANVPASAAPDASKAQVLPFAAHSLLEMPARQDAATKSENQVSWSQSDSQAQAQGQAPDPSQVSAAAKPGASSGIQPPSPAELNLPAVPPEPAPTAVQTTDSAPSGPSTLAFAARMSTAASKTNQAAGANAAPVPAVPGSQAPAQIPVRYAPTAQIIQSAAGGAKEDGSKKDPGAALDPSVRADARADSRTDMVAPRIEIASQTSPSSAPAPPPPPAPSAQMERIIETPAAPTASNHDIRVRVPDSSGGSTQVRFVESGGEVRVSVRTADEGLAQNLRTHLNDLTQRLSDGGMPAEIWRPTSNGASPQNNQNPSQQDGRGSGGQGSGGQGGQQDRQQKRPAWLDEMEASLEGEQN